MLIPRRQSVVPFAMKRVAHNGAPSRVLDFSLNDGWKKLMYSRDDAYNCESAFVR